MRIVISGKIGSGKTTVAKKLAKKLNYKYISAGEIFRQIAKDKNLSLIELSKLAESDPSIDFEIDKRQKELSEKEENIIIDSRLGAWLLNCDLKVYLIAPLEIRAKRVSVRENVPYEKALKEIVEREKSEMLRYKKYYKIDVNNLEIFDLIINTSKFSPDQICEIIYNATIFLKDKN